MRKFSSKQQQSNLIEESGLEEHDIEFVWWVVGGVCKVIFNSNPTSVRLGLG